MEEDRVNKCLQIYEDLSGEERDLFMNKVEVLEENEGSAFFTKFTKEFRKTNPVEQSKLLHKLMGV